MTTLARRYTSTCLNRSYALSQCPRQHLWAPLRQTFHTTSRQLEVRPFLLSDPGEGIKEVQIIQWFVQPGARVEQFDKVCEVASDKANIEITSRFDGVIRKLHHEQDDVVQVGKALFDIDVQSEIAPEDEGALAPKDEDSRNGKEVKGDESSTAVSEDHASVRRPPPQPPPESHSRHATLATPAVRGMLKELNIQITDVKGTGKDGRVLKEDVQRFIAERETNSQSSPPHQATSTRPATDIDETQVETTTPLMHMQKQMFKSMTKSLSVPHFVYADEVDVSSLSTLRKSLNQQASPDVPKLSLLHFIIKAVSLALEDFPLLNARLDSASPTPNLIHRSKHNIGIAIDTPQGLLVPNIKNVAARSVLDIAHECQRLQSLALSGKLTPHDLSGGTITVSNIGNIGGTYLAPVLIPDTLAILGLGRARTIPAFESTPDLAAAALPRVIAKQVMNMSWSADHRVIDGASMARVAERVRGWVERPESMVTRLR